jgi:XTP/dITP diphosphohydrolase
VTLPSELLAATSNPHKLDEIRAVLAPLAMRVLSLDDAGCADLPEPDENADTFAGNAEIKAVAYAKATGRVCLADDSGLEVDALDGAPGVYSARYAGVGDTRAERDAANNAKLLDALKDVPDAQRTARFVCAMCVADPDGNNIATSRGTFGGVIGRAPRGDNGFGYDPLLVLPDGRTSAELPPAEKNARSHRGAALRELVKTLRV